MAMKKRTSRRPYKKRRNYRRRAVNIPRSFRGQGFFKIARRTGDILIQNSATPGTPNINDPTGTMLSVGTPVANPNGNLWDLPFSLQFSINQLAGFTDITGLADSYMIKYVRVRVWQNSQYGTNGQAAATVRWITDHDDASVPTVLSIREKMGVRTNGFYDNKPVVMGVCPRVAVNAYRDPPAVTSGYIVPKQNWVNSTYTDVLHYGIKGVFQDLALGGTGIGVATQLRLEVEFYVMGKDLQ